MRIAPFDIAICEATVAPPSVFSEGLLFGDIEGKRILDVGTGCGIIALFAKRSGAAYVLGVDINDRAISSARLNLKHNFGDSPGIDFEVSDLFEHVTGRFDIIAMHPPYLSEEAKVREDYKSFGGNIVERLLRDGKDYLNPNGEIRILYPTSKTPDLARLAIKYRYTFGAVNHIPKSDALLLRLLLHLSILPPLRIHLFRKT